MFTLTVFILSSILGLLSTAMGLFMIFDFLR